jgi:hypothetical protein
MTTVTNKIIHLTISTSLGLHLEMDKWKIKMMMMMVMMMKKNNKTVDMHGNEIKLFQKEEIK